MLVTDTDNTLQTPLRHVVYLNTKDAGIHARAAAINAIKSSKTCEQDFTAEQKQHIKNIARALGTCFECAKMYISYRKTFASITLRSPIRNPASYATKYINGLQDDGVVIKITAQSTIFEIPKT